MSRLKSIVSAARRIGLTQIIKRTVAYLGMSMGLVLQDSGSTLLGHDIADHVAVDIGKAIVTPRVTIGELLVIQSHEVEYGRL